MQHTIGYIINTDNDRIHLEYREMEYAPSVSIEWIDGVNSFSSLDEADPYEYDSAPIIRVVNGENITYYQRTLMLDEGINNFTVSVLIDGVEGKTSFIVEEYVPFLSHKVVGSEVYFSVSANKTQHKRYGTISFMHRANENINDILYIEQEECNISIMLEKCYADNGEYSVEYTINNNEFEYQFDTLTDKTDVNKQTLDFRLLLEGPHRSFFVKTIKQYVQIGEIDETYKYMDGEFYQRRQKLVKDRFVTYYAKVMVIDNMVYDLQSFDNGLKIEKRDNNLLITNFGRTFLCDDSFYLITICNYDDVKSECTIKITYADNPINTVVV